MTPQELKNSILQLAIQGKLVEQRPEEGTAEELFQKIQEEKQRLIAEKRIKKEKPLPEITEDERPFDIPESWKWVRLSEFATLYNGRAYKQNELLSKGKYPVLRVGNLFTNNQWYYSDLDLEPEKYCHNGDLLYSWSASFGPHIWNGGKVIYHYHIWKIEYSNRIDRDYLFYMLLADTEQIKRSGHGLAMIHVTKAGMERRPFPLPPLIEQKRIVAKIEELLPYIDRYEQAWSKLEQFNSRFPEDMKKTLLQYAIQGKLVEQCPEDGTAEELFAQIQEEKQRLIAEKKIKKEKPLPEITEDEKPFDIPESWKWVRLGNCGSWGSGATPSRTNSEYYGGTVPWLKTGDLNDGTITEIPEYITELALEKTSVRLNPIGSVLMAMYGATIGKLGILGIEATTNQACCACIPYEGLYNKFLFYFLMASRTAFIKLGEGGAQPNISKEKIVNALIPLPPLAEQKRIVEKLEQLLPLCERLK